MEKKKNLIALSIAILVFLILFLLVYYKIKNNGNNISKLNGNIKEYILNISSYEAELDVTIISNKTTNKYLIKQLYYKPNLIKQVIIEPKNLENLSIIYDGLNMKIENTNLSLSKIYENYEYINKNTLWLCYFIEKCKDYKVTETEKEIIIEKNNKYNNYNVKQVLYIEKQTGLPSKMEVYDNNKNTKIYIKYNEVKLNKTNRNKILEE